jgi:hypothetical protein
MFGFRFESLQESAVKLVADTNVWYDVGAGERNLAALKAGGSRLVATAKKIGGSSQAMFDGSRSHADRVLRGFSIPRTRCPSSRRQ